MPFPTATWTSTISKYQRAELPGRRFIQASEVRERGHLHEDFIKSLTGSDTVNARRIYGRPFTFVPVGKFWLRCNDRPVIKDLTHSMWRRVKLIPFTQTFGVDTTLAAALLAELPGVLNWALEGCRLWRLQGLCEPACVQAATAEYRDASDVLSEFIADRCQVADGCSVGGRELFAAYQAWEAARREQSARHVHAVAAPRRAADLPYAASPPTYVLRVAAERRCSGHLRDDTGGAREHRYHRAILRSMDPEVGSLPDRATVRPAHPGAGGAGGGWFRLRT
jgi:hypothetical protein